MAMQLEKILKSNKINLLENYGVPLLALSLAVCLVISIAQPVSESLPNFRGHTSSKQRQLVKDRLIEGQVRRLLRQVRQSAAK